MKKTNETTKNVFWFLLAQMKWASIFFLFLFFKGILKILGVEAGNAESVKSVKLFRKSQGLYPKIPGPWDWHNLPPAMPMAMWLAACSSYLLLGSCAT